MQGKPPEKEVAKKKPIEPTLHFRTEPIAIGEDETSEPVTVAELVPEGHLLADFPNFAKFAALGYSRVPLEPGDFAYLGEDEFSVLAAVPGYPKIRKIRRKDVAEMITVVSIEPVVLISPDNMKASLVIHPPLQDGHSLQKETLEELLHRQNIVYGLNPDAIAHAKNLIAEGAKEFNRVLIASGQLVGESTDAFLRFDLEIGPIAGIVLPDGSIDFRERRVMVGVSAGEIIATKIPASQGKPGINVFAEETPAREGKDLKVEVINDARYSPQTMQVTATRDGVLSVTNNKVIKVCSHQVINGDIDYEIGNVDSHNSVTINGSIQPGFRITVGGDLKVGGSVMSAKLHCGGNLVVRGGITGKNSVLKVTGDADISFIEQGNLECGGIVVIRRQCYYSRIIAGGDIRCQPSSIIMGGELVAAGSISLGDVGGENSEPATISAGVLVERLDELMALKKAAVEQQDAIVQWLQRYRGSSSSKKVREMEKQLAETKLLLLRVNLIPGTGRYSRVAGPDGAAVAEGDDYRSDGGIAIESIKVDVNGTILAGTMLRIGNRRLKLEKTVSARRFRLNPSGKQIIATPIRQ